MGRHREFDTNQALDGAMKVFWRQGYASAEIKDICDGTGLNPGSLYAAFGSKHGLFIAVVQRYLDTINRPALDLLVSNPCGLDGIRSYFNYIAEGIVHGNRHWGCLGTNAFLELDKTDEKVSMIMTKHLLDLEKAFCDALQRDGIQQAPKHAKYLLCISQGLNVVAKTSPTQEDLLAMIDTAIVPLAFQPIAAE